MRKTLLLSAVLASLLSLPAIAVQDQAIPDDALGLSKTSVYDVPDPYVVNYAGGDPGTNKRLAKSYHTAPPMITHTINDMVPITRDFNLCKDCHVQPDLIGKKLSAGMPIPAPASHYTNVKKGELYMGRWNCMQCHTPQAKVDVLVQSTFKKPK
ncbi:MAG: nitrate reductase cytochrome c-type subunit [Pseudomonadota bacterium]|nr:nitrate reductase cytochrome c-type subunit [Pseudomonadota bacterium]MDP1903249.1 nitrate reductase cytochrome c-type subunit [Pseudomonadota bacterium]MDP2352758.1 nitrate reductase cytochrome c-type subunit [Pseudomonadota bacterium]